MFHAKKVVMAKTCFVPTSVLQYHLIIEFDRCLLLFQLFNFTYSNMEPASSPIRFSAAIQSLHASRQ